MTKNRRASVKRHKKMLSQVFKFYLGGVVGAGTTHLHAHYQKQTDSISGMNHLVIESIWNGLAWPKRTYTLTLQLGDSEWGKKLYQDYGPH